MSMITVAVLRMPDDMFWDDHPLYRAQHNAARMHAADELERLQGENESLQMKLKSAKTENLRIIRIAIGTNDEFQIVPTEPTIEMIAALGFDGDVDLAVGHGAVSESIADAYKKALAVALAAKACGLEIVKYSMHGVPYVDLGIPCPWNPLTNNGDAFSLMVDLGLRVNCFEKTVVAQNIPSRSGLNVRCALYGDHKDSTVRKVIVLVAAEIGKSL